LVDFPVWRQIWGNLQICSFPLFSFPTISSLSLPLPPSTTSDHYNHSLQQNIHPSTLTLPLAKLINHSTWHSSICQPTNQDQLSLHFGDNVHTGEIKEEEGKSLWETDMLPPIHKINNIIAPPLAPVYLSAAGLHPTKTSSTQISFTTPINLAQVSSIHHLKPNLTCQTHTPKAKWNLKLLPNIQSGSWKLLQIQFNTSAKDPRTVVLSTH
jgi:hypothetical protein